LARDSLLRIAVTATVEGGWPWSSGALYLSESPPPGLTNANRLLAALPAADYSRILPALTVIPLKLRDVLHRPGEPIREVYFPGGGFCSMLTVLEDGKMVEIATVGREGMIGVSAILDGAPVTSAAMVQGATGLLTLSQHVLPRRSSEDDRARAPFGNGRLVAQVGEYRDDTLDRVMVRLLAHMPLEHQAWRPG
jgi:CRP-like cAMP-binding protein